MTTPTTLAHPLRDPAEDAPRARTTTGCCPTSTPDPSDDLLPNRR